MPRGNFDRFLKTLYHMNKSTCLECFNLFDMPRHFLLIGFLLEDVEFSINLFEIND